MLRSLYSALYTILLPLVLLRKLWRSRRAPEYRRRWAERFAFFAAPPRSGCIWVHAVSVGETIAAAPLIENLLLRYPQHRVVVTTTTPTGSERVRTLFADRVFHVYAPYDLPGPVQRFLRKLQPQLLIIMETELWPNMLHYTRRSGCKIILANARLSAKSAKGYGRIQGLTRAMLANLDSVACQSAADGQRLLALGLPPERLQVSGSIKFDIELDAELRGRAQALRRDWCLGERPVIVAASTHRGEEEQILSAFGQLRERFDDALLVLVPRHPERFNQVLSQCEAAGWQVLCRSSGRAPQAATDIVLGDTMGELLLLLSIARIAFIGGSLVPHGGHNVLEAAAWGVPIITGPHMFNFAEISELLSAAGGMKMLSDAAQLGDELCALLADEALLQAMGRAAQAVVAQNRGARGRLETMIGDLLPVAG